MECQPSDSKQVFKVFDASKRKRTRKKRDGYEDSNSVATDESVGVCHGNGRCITSAKASLQDLPGDLAHDVKSTKRDRDSSPSVSHAPTDQHRTRSPRRHRRSAMKEDASLALKPEFISTPRSLSPLQDGVLELPKEQDSFIYAFLEEAIKRDKKKPKEKSRSPVDQTALLETFAKLCAQMSEKTAKCESKHMARTQSHKSLQCEVLSRKESYDVERRQTRLNSREQSRDVSPSYTRSYENFRSKVRSRDNIAALDRKDKCPCCPKDKETPRYTSKLDIGRSKILDQERYAECGPDPIATRPSVDDYYRAGRGRRSYKEYDERDRLYYNDRLCCEQKASRSFEVQKGHDDDKFRRSARSDFLKDKEYEDFKRRLDDRHGRQRYYDDKNRERSFAQVPSKERRPRRNVERFDRSSIASRDEDYKERERYSERERDSGLSVADGETSTISGRSNYLKVVKQEISEQREAMDKMMRLWKELMRCFKGVSETPCRDKDSHQESAENMQESAAAQLRLWRECMRRYETVARDVGDTDARLMEEINKQRSEMAEMASMWQECLQRYRDMSNDFNNLKQQLATSESPTRPPQPPLVCAEGEGVPPPAQYRIPPVGYPQMPPIPPYSINGSPLRSRASAPPAWWWGGEGAGAPQPARRRSSPDSCASRERRHRHKERERDSSRYKEKSSKPSGARSEHRHRKR
ncbi:unnamed protein product [Leptosia nina]|uniref:Uncharacterized protein n=1 Tax=Leptosia nina TaxID=320188 RepID=A0AAV1J813_9NEOP